MGLASRFQGWTEFEPLAASSSFGHLIENLVCIEICRFFQNQGLKPEIFFIRSKEKVEVDFLVKLANNRWVAIEVKTTPIDFTAQQMKLLEQTQLNIIAHWVVSPSNEDKTFKNSQCIGLQAVHDCLAVTDGKA